MKRKFDDVDRDAYRLAHLIAQTGEGEYVVIVSPGESLQEQVRDGYSISEVVEICDDCTTFPCDRELTA